MSGEVYDPAKDKPIPELMDALIVQCRAVAWKHWHAAPYVLEFSELESLAYRGIVEAANRWERYCAERGFNPAITRFFSVYCLRRANGSILDYMRSQDWVSRTVRNNARALREAGQDLGRSEAEMAAASGLTRQEVSETLAAMNRRPVQFDPVEHDIPDMGGTESQALADSLTTAAVAALEKLPLATQYAVVLTFYYGQSTKSAATVMGLETAEVAALQQAGVMAVHAALCAAARDRED